MHRQTYLDSAIPIEYRQKGYHLKDMTDSMLALFLDKYLMKTYCNKITLGEIHSDITDHWLSVEFKQLAGEK